MKRMERLDSPMWNCSATVDNAIRHTMYMYGKAGYLYLVEVDPDTDLCKEERNRTEVIQLTDTYDEDAADDYAGGSSVAMIGLGAVNQISSIGAERFFGVLKYMESPYDTVKEIVGEDANITGEADAKDLTKYTAESQEGFVEALQAAKHRNANVSSE